MKIYFSAAIAQKDQYGHFYNRIINFLKKSGHIVFQDTTKVGLKEAINKSDQDRIKYYRQVLEWISNSDLVVLEVSFPSTLHIGHEVSLALDKSKPVIALYHHGKEPSFFLGLEHSKIFWGDYNSNNLEFVIKEGVSHAVNNKEIRFNFFISPNQTNHLDKMSRKFNIPRSVYLRNLINIDIEKNSY